MKKSVLLLVTALFSTSASAASFPELYCVSTRSFERVVQINLFTNKKGTLRLGLQYYATDGEHWGYFDTGILETVRGLKFDKKTGVLGNSVGKAELVIDPQELTPEDAEALLKRPGRVGDPLNPAGLKITFKRYYAARMAAYTLKGKKGYWSKDLRRAFDAGVVDYVCGNFKDAIGRRPGIFDEILSE